jgi:protein TonB
MSNPKKTHELIRQNEKIVKKSQKHDANLQKNSTLYFQIGLIVCLLFTFSLFEMTFETDIPNISKRTKIEKPFSIDIPIIRPLTPTFNEPIEKNLVKEPTEYIEVPDETPDDLFKKEPNESKVDLSPPLEPGEVNVVKIDEDVIIPVDFVEVVPIYPGCEKSKNNTERKKCMSEKIAKLIQKKFDTNIGERLGLSGKQTIRTQFKIDKTGNISDIKVKGTHAELEKEAERVINIIPEMTPGKQSNRNVGVIYSLPIVFQVQN